MKCKCKKEMEKVLDTSDVVKVWNQAVDVCYCNSCGSVAINRWVSVDSDKPLTVWYERKI